MTIREVLLRRYRLNERIAFGFGVVFFVSLYGAKRVEWLMYVVAACVVLIMCVLVYLETKFRCPRCQVRLGNLRLSLSSKRPVRRFNYCPGCGVSLDSESGSV